MWHDSAEPQPADETADQEWLAFLAQQVEDSYNAMLADPAYHAWADEQARISEGMRMAGLMSM